MGTTDNQPSLVTDQVFIKLLAKMDDDADKAEKEWRTQLTSPDTADFPADLKKQYQSDGTEMTRARGNFNLEWNKIAAGRGEVAKLEGAYNAYAAALGALWANNARFEALIEAKIAARAAAVVAGVGLLAKAGASAEFLKEMRDLQKDLQKAQREVRDTKIKAALNVAISTATIVFTTEARLAKLAISAGAITTHVIIDHAFGEGSTKGTVVTVIGDAPGAIKAFEGAVEKNFGALGMVLTLKFDTEEIADSLKSVAELEKRIERTRKDYERLMTGMGAGEMGRLDAALKSLVQAVNNAMAKASDANLMYQETIRNSIKKAK